MDLPTERGRHGIQSASLAFVCTLVAVVFATGLELAAPAPSATETAYASGPISTFPASWDNFCGLPVQGEKTTVYEGLPIANSTLSQIYFKIVNSSTFRAHANGSSWVTVAWGSHGFVDSGQFVFVSGGRPDGSAQFDYSIDTGQVTFSYGPLQASCANNAP